MAAWDQAPLEAPGAIFSRQPDYAETMAKIMSSPGATFRAGVESNRDYAAELQKQADLKKYQEGLLAVDQEKNRLAGANAGPVGPWGKTGGLEGADANILWAANQPGGDINSPEAQAAFGRQYRTMKPFTRQMPDGSTITEYKYPIQPPSIKTPTAEPGGPAAPAPPPAPDGTSPPPDATGGPAPAPLAPAAPGAEPAASAPAATAAAAAPSAKKSVWATDDPDIGGRPKTEAENRALARLTIGNNAYKGAADNWDALSQGPGEWGTLANEVGQSIGGPVETLVGAGTNYAMTDKYQQAATGVASLAQTYLYAMSGANAPIAEANKIIAAVMPKVGDKPGQLAAKRRTLDAMKAALEAQAALPASPPPIDAALASQQMIDIATGAGGGEGGGPAPAGGAGGAGEAPVEEWHRDPNGQLVPGAG